MNLTPVSSFDDVYQLETTDYALGGPGGTANQQAQSLLNRTEYLKDTTDSLIDGTGFDPGAIPAAALKPGITTTHARQSVLFCRMTTGVPDVLMKVSNSILRIQALSTITEDNRLILSFAAGFGSEGPKDYFGIIAVDTDVDISLFVSPAGTPVYVYVERDAITGILTAKVTDKAPVYNILQPTGSSGQFWFNTNDHIMRKWNTGTSTFDAIQAVFVGQISRDGLGNLTTTLSNYPIRIHRDAHRINTPGTCKFDFGNVIVPEGYLFCDGSAISRNTYRELFNAIGTTYGVGDGSTTFNIPDCRGEFLRGFDAGRGIDSGRVFGSLQLDDFEAHSHQVFYSDTVGAGANAGAVDAVGSSESSGSTGGSETRPRNIAVNIYIKY